MRVKAAHARQLLGRGKVTVADLRGDKGEISIAGVPRQDVHVLVARREYDAAGDGVVDVRVGVVGDSDAAGAVSE